MMRTFTRILCAVVAVLGLGLAAVSCRSRPAADGTGEPAVPMASSDALDLAALRGLVVDTYSATYRFSLGDRAAAAAYYRSHRAALDAAIRSPQAEAYGWAVLLIGAFSPRSVVGQLGDIIIHGAAQERQLALQCAAQAGSGLGCPLREVASAYQAPEPDVRMWALLADACVNQSAVDRSALMGLVSHGAATVRQSAAYGLSATAGAERQATADLIAPLLLDPDEGVRLEAAVTLAPLGDERALPEAERMAASDDALLAATGCLVLATIGRGAPPETLVAEVGSGLRHDEARVRVQAAAAAIHLGSAAAPLRQQLSELARSSDDVERVPAVLALAACGDPSVRPDLLTILDGQWAEGRWRAAQWLAWLPGADSDTVSALERHATDENAYVRMLAAWALGRLGDLAMPSRPALRLLLRDPDPYTALMAAQSLALLGDSQGLRLQTDGLRSTSPTLRATAVAGLAAQGPRGRSAIHAARLCLDDTDPRVRRWAVVALGFLGDAQRAQDLRGLAEADDMLVRAWATGALAALGDADAERRLHDMERDGRFDVRCYARDALVTLSAGRP
jgi:HEAT repeat protein